MCTATWMESDRFQCFLFNRDEKRTRPIEEPPKVHETPGHPRFIAPTDPQSGGTWIAVNEYGLIAAVFNHYEARTLSNRPTSELNTSRGTLPLLAISEKQIQNAEPAVSKKVREETFEPFLMWLRSPDQTGFLLKWDGDKLEKQPLSEIRQPVTTSSWRSAEVAAYRRELFQKTVHPPFRLDELIEFHSIQENDLPAHGPTMIRDDATTRSLSLVRIDSKDISMRHQHFNPGSRMFEEPVEVRIPRRF